MKMVKYNLADIKEMKIRLGKQLGELKLQTVNVESCFRQVEQVIQCSKKAPDNSEIILPEDFLCATIVSQCSRKKVEWKKLVKQTISDSNIFLNCQMIFDKGRILFPLQSIHRRDCIKSISSALTNLIFEGKIGKFKDDRTKLFYYGDIDKHFTKEGKANMKYFIKK